jgi:hypothetical protein
MHISGKTRMAALFGYPVEHTLSPVMQNAAFDHLGLDCCYLPFSVPPDSLKQAVESIRALSLLGANLTIPHKEAVIPMLDSIDEEALAIGAVNTIVNTEERLRGYNTDGRGFMRSLEEHGVTAAGKRILIIGTGDADRGRTGDRLGRDLVRDRVAAGHPRPAGPGAGGPLVVPATRAGAPPVRTRAGLGRRGGRSRRGGRRRRGRLTARTPDRQEA